MRQWTVQRVVRTGRHTRELASLQIVAATGAEASRAADQVKHDREKKAGLLG